MSDNLKSNKRWGKKRREGRGGGREGSRDKSCTAALSEEGRAETAKVGRWTGLKHNVSTGAFSEHSCSPSSRTLGGCRPQV